MTLLPLRQPSDLQHPDTQQKYVIAETPTNTGEHTIVKDQREGQGCKGNDSVGWAC